MSEKKFIRSAADLTAFLHGLVNDYGLDEKFIPSPRTVQRLWKQLPKTPDGVMVDSAHLIKESWAFRGEKEISEYLGYDVRHIRRLNQNAAQGSEGLLYDLLLGKKIYSQNSADVWDDRHQSKRWKREHAIPADVGPSTNEKL